MDIKDKVLSVGLTLNKTEQRYFERLIAHDWCYVLSDTDYEFRKGLKAHNALKQIADTKKGNYLTLWHRVSDKMQNYQFHKASLKAGRAA